MRLDLTAEKKLAKRIAISAGPSLNFLYLTRTDVDAAGMRKDLLPTHTFSQSSWKEYDRFAWIGFKIGARFF
jgi:hypothetical protein